MKNFAVTFAFMFAAAFAHADQLPEICPKATTSSVGTAVFIMVPKLEGGYFKPDKSGGTMYLVDGDGSLTKLWNVSGWYSHAVFLTNDGDYLVRIGPWNSGAHPSKEDLALSFYKGGRLLRSYSTAELIRAPNAVRVTTSHYEWRSEEPPYIGMGEFWLTTIEGRFFVFDLESGAIKSVRDPKEEKK